MRADRRKDSLKRVDFAYHTKSLTHTCEAEVYGCRSGVQRIRLPSDILVLPRRNSERAQRRLLEILSRASDDTRHDNAKQ